MATLVDVTGADYPERHRGFDILPMEGKSLLPAFDDRPIDRDTLYWEHKGNAAVLSGDWKLVRLSAQGNWELYNLKADRTEQHDLSAKHPQRVAELTEKWRAWAKHCHVVTNGLPRKSGR